MIFRCSGALCAVVLTLGLVVDARSAQTLRFDTNVGTFDMVLNPTGNPFLQGHVDNILAYVEAGRYDKTVINRVNQVDSTDSVPDFVMQMGSLRAHTLTLPTAFSEFPSIAAFDPVIVDEDGDGAIDFDTTGYTNSRGTVSMALSAAGPNSATSSFFINLNDIPSLDPGGSIGEFIPFATIKDMATIDLIQSLNTAALSGGGVASSNIPVLDDNRLVIIERVFVLNPAEILTGSSPADSTDGDSSSSEETLGNDSNSSDGLSVPEPASLVTALGALMLLAVGRRHSLA